jgi:hypothetical protein
VIGQCRDGKRQVQDAPLSEFAFAQALATNNPTDCVECAIHGCNEAQGQDASFVNDTRLYFLKKNKTLFFKPNPTPAMIF